MALTRIADGLTYAFLTDRANRLQVQLRVLQEQVASGRRLIDAEDDPLGAAQAARADASLAALGQYEESSRFGAEVLGAQDDALGEAEQLLVRAEEIATQQATGLVSAAERAAAREEVHGLLQALTAAANNELAGRRLFGGLALDAPAPFADPDAPGYTPATAYGGSTQDFWVKVGSGAGERVRVTTRGDQVFSSALQALQDLETALATPGADVAATLAGLAAGRGDLAAERASVAARQAALVGRVKQVEAVAVTEQAGRARVLEADPVETISRLVQAQTALQALLSAGSQIARTSLVNLLEI
jgi:flagellar hook-associated protein 3 FlgL